MNLNLYGHAGKWLMVDLGVTFGDESTPGIEVIMPDISFIKERVGDLVGLVLTHAHALLTSAKEGERRRLLRRALARRVGRDGPGRGLVLGERHGRVRPVHRRRRSEHELAHRSRMTDRNLQRDARAVAESEHIGPIDVKLCEQRCHVVGGRRETDGGVAVAGATVRLLFDGDDVLELLLRCHRVDRIRDQDKLFRGGSGLFRVRAYAGAAHGHQSFDVAFGERDAYDRRVDIDILRCEFDIAPRMHAAKFIAVDKLGIDITIVGSQKCLGAPPGLAPVSVSARARQAMAARSRPPTAWYFDLDLLGKYYGPERAYHHTVSASLIYALREGLRLVAEEGLGALKEILA